MEYTEAIAKLNEWFDLLNKLKFENTLSKPIISIASDPKGSCYGWCISLRTLRQQVTPLLKHNLIYFKKRGEDEVGFIGKLCRVDVGGLCFA